MPYSRNIVWPWAGVYSSNVIESLGDAALVVRLATHVDEAVRRAVAAACHALDDLPPPGLLDLVPGFTTITIHYDPAAVVRGAPAGATPYEIVRDHVGHVLADLRVPPDDSARLVEIPVCYDEAFGPDLPAVAAHTGLAAAEVIARHAAAEYRVHLLGFMPGFPYLGGLDPALVTPRRETPRTAVPAGSVGIGGRQTGVYPLATPGGWQIIGRTPLHLFAPLRDPPTLLEPGDRVRFHPIDRAAFDRLAAERP